LEGGDGEIAGGEVAKVGAEVGVVGGGCRDLVGDVKEDFVEVEESRRNQRSGIRDQVKTNADIDRGGRRHATAPKIRRGVAWLEWVVMLQKAGALKGTATQERSTKDNSAA
jgi:NAD+--asparagine ADP-ribosyltransferase